METEKLSGPYRATKLWNEAIELFRTEMPLRKHRRHMRSYEDCFTGSEAVTWFHGALQKNPNFGEEVTREQITQLLEKFYAAGVFINIIAKSAESTREPFKESGHIYRFCRSPLKNIQLSNLMTRNLNLPAAKRPILPALECSPKAKKPSPPVAPPQPGVNTQRFLTEVKNKAIEKQKQQLEEDDVWKSVVLGRLEALLSGVDIEQLLPPDEVCGQWIYKNASDAELVGPLPLEKQMAQVKGLPNWIVAAMKTLVYWPNAGTTSLTSLRLSGYMGFEKDVFQEVVKYFNDSETPLISSALYNAVTHAFLYLEFAEFMDKLKKAAQQQPPKDFPISSKSTENLVLGMSSPVKAERSLLTNPFLHLSPPLAPYRPSPPEPPTPQIPPRAPSTNPFLDYVSTPPSHEPKPSRKYYQPQFYTSELNEAVENFDDEINGSKILSTVLPPNSCFETAFTSETPTTRIIPQQKVDTIHFKNKRQRPQSCVPPEEIYVSMDKLKNPFRDPTPPKRSHRYRGPSSHHNHSQNDLLHAELAFIEETKNKRHSVAYPDIGRCQSVPANLLAPKLPPKTRRPRSKVNDLKHVRNQSGGYINLALSYEDGSPNMEEVMKRELDVPAAMQSLYTLMRCSQPPPQQQPVEHSTPTVQGERVENNFSVSSIASYHTASSELQLEPVASRRGSVRSIKHSRSASVDTSLDFPGLKRIDGKQMAIEILQLLLLMLPPANRRKLTLLLHFMESVAANSQLHLDPKLPNRVVLVQSFMRAILSPGQSVDGPSAEDSDSDLVKRVAGFLLEEAESVLSVPADLRAEVYHHIANYHEQQLKFRQEELLQQLHTVEREMLSHSMAAGLENRAPLAPLATLPRSTTLPRLPRPITTYCERVSKEVFEDQKFTSSRQALAELLEQIIADKKMPMKDKRKRLAAFKEAYPHIYEKRFPTPAEEEKVMQLKKQGLFSRFKSLRL